MADGFAVARPKGGKGAWSRGIDSAMDSGDFWSTGKGKSPAKGHGNYKGTESWDVGSDSEVYGNADVWFKGKDSWSHDAQSLSEWAFDTLYTGKGYLKGKSGDNVAGLEAGADGTFDQWSWPSEVIEVPRGSVGLIIGPGGSRIQELEARSGTLISISQTHDRDAARISGTHECISYAKFLLCDLLLNNWSSRDATSQPNTRMDSIKNPDGRPVSAMAEG
eukprot:CAMPEP_0180421238 /NCGR_PEP_ID=MMETSP1036_2-20121128/3046_1 /TAXON_ID=632150 /ORGANISM="Azadinium spinosum, Strain 3D9" /LENGTH=219 /DNA_ID=CAMNT_0022426493 /DNA_START=184 /DNA_END=839 /DNA_ORIENTATION=+